MALLTSSIGSFPKPQALHEARRRFQEGEIDAAALRLEEDAAAREVLALQDELAISLLVDGEMDRADPITTFAERLAGVEIGGWVRVCGDRYVRRPKITGALARTVSTLDRYASELLRMADLIGPEHVMFGTDVDGLGSGALIDDFADMRKVVEILSKRGIEEQVLSGICIGNYARCLKRAMKERVATAG